MTSFKKVKACGICRQAITRQGSTCRGEPGPCRRASRRAPGREGGNAPAPTRVCCVCQSVCGALAGREVAGRGGWLAEAPAHVAVCQPRARASSVRLSPRQRALGKAAGERGAVLAGGCSDPLPRSLPAAPGGTQAVSCPLARVPSRRAPCEGRRAEMPREQCGFLRRRKQPRAGIGPGGRF